MSLNQMLGNIEKAIIEITDLRGRQVTVSPPVEAGGSSGGIGGRSINVSPAVGTGGLPSMRDALPVSAAASSLAGQVAGDNPLTQAIGGVGAAGTKKIFHVQFNPSELSISGYGGMPVSKTNFGGTGGGGVKYEPAKVRITMSVNLIFDKVNPKDAFMADKLNMAPTAIATGVAKAVMTAKGKNDNSVQKEVEGFLAALRSPDTSKITFRWGAMAYTGILNRVSAQYTMFNVQGLPIRAIVSLALVCADADVSPSSMGMWQKFYQQAFGDNKSYVGTAQKMGNLLNVNL